LAILETMGFVRRQMWVTVACQTSTLVGVALLLGLPIGALVGRFAWSVFVDGLGAVREPQVAWLPIVATIPAALVLANLIATPPGWLGARVRPAVALRGE